MVGHDLARAAGTFTGVSFDAAASGFHRRRGQEPCRLTACFTGIPEGPLFNDASLDNQRSLSTRLLRSSAGSGWTAALLEQRRCEEAARDFQLRPTPDVHLVVQTGGRQRVEVLKHGAWSSANYGPGSAGMTAGGEADRIRSFCDEPFELAHLFLPQLTLQEAADALRRAGQASSCRSLSALVVEDPAIAATVGALLAALDAGATDLYAQHAVHWLATHLLVVHGGADPHNADPGSERLGDRRLSRALALVRARFAEPLTLDELASEAAMSKFHFSRLFRKRTGRSPHAFVVHERMEAARRLLAGSDLPVAEVASRTGYGGTVQFAAAFRRHSGLTPTAFRRGLGGPAEQQSV